MYNVLDYNIKPTTNKYVKKYYYIYTIVVYIV